MVAKIGTNTDCITCWPNFLPMQVAFYFAGEITQVLDAIPWVRCASGMFPLIHLGSNPPLFNSIWVALKWTSTSVPFSPLTHVNILADAKIELILLSTRLTLLSWSSSYPTIRLVLFIVWVCRRACGKSGTISCFQASNSGHWHWPAWLNAGHSEKVGWQTVHCVHT